MKTYSCTVWQYYYIAVEDVDNDAYVEKQEKQKMEKQDATGCLSWIPTCMVNECDATPSSKYLVAIYITQMEQFTANWSI